MNRTSCIVVCVVKDRRHRVAGDSGPEAMVGGNIKGQSGRFTKRSACPRMSNVGEEHLRTLGDIAGRH
jgi:hypothetical protein